MAGNGGSGYSVLQHEDAVSVLVPLPESSSSNDEVDEVLDDGDAKHHPKKKFDLIGYFKV